MNDMINEFKKAIKARRSIYSLNSNSPVSDQDIKELIDFAVLHVPSAFNSQSTRVVLLLGEHHTKLWDIVKNTLKKIVPEDSYPQSEQKINGSFASGYGTILFFEDQSVVENLQQNFPSYSENFPKWSQHTSGMHQFAIWTMLESIGFGASLQHYNPIIDEEIAKTWNIAANWKLIAQMPFGTPTAPAGEKEFEPLEKRVLIFK